ncbi:hypothetical protein XENTR_v10003128 [Xenopus tropicalis]|uniref:Uncharacterized protein LOC116408354 n=1 Tax=Xenopus tropicalis TaxID=8364 RepID=A0A8J1IZG2_XENTR|nr:uncharacterized protein LOC116408354 [Xenopus tropicalis]KAE8636770.1 hypothetical protein XENTR_v10003128 [Xenopus tropicalis]
MITDRTADEMSTHADSSKGSTSTVYEIVVVSVAGTMLLASALIFLLAVARKRGYNCVFYGMCTEEKETPNINVSRNTQDTISTIDLPGPVHITYVNEKEIPITRVKLSRDALLYISLITCMNLPDDIESEESL